MPTVYKYCDTRGAEILERLELKVTPPNQFNDPFEFTPHMICTDPIRRARDILRTKRYLRSFYDKWVASGRFIGNFAQFRDYVKKHRKDMAQDMSPWLPQAAADTGRELINKTSLMYGVLCLSKTRSSILMWGHYCDCHRGIVIGFNPEHATFAGLDDVKYVRERVVFDSSWVEKDLRVMGFEKQIVFSKNVEWAYEQETRIFIRLRRLNQRVLVNGVEGYFLTVPPESVISVTFGVRCAEDLKSRVFRAIGAPQFNHVAVDQARLHESDFAIEFEDTEGPRSKVLA